MAELKKIYSEKLAPSKFVGRAYTSKDKTNDTFTEVWLTWFDNGLFKPLEALLNENASEEQKAYIGLSRCKQGEDFVYWIGMFLPLDAPTPKGYDEFIPNISEIAVCWVYGSEPDIYFYCCLDELEKAGYIWAKDENGVAWHIERYVSPRFNEPDELGNRILDMCFSL